MSFIGGLVIAAIIAFFVAKSVLRAEMKHANEQIGKLEGELAKAEENASKRVREAKEEADKSRKESMDELEKRFDIAIDKLKSEVEVKTGEMLKSRQEEFSKKSNEDIGQILTPLKEKIKDLKEAMDKGNETQAQFKEQMRTQVENIIKQSDAARKSADELANALMYGSKVQGDWGETILEELLSAQGLTKGVNFDTQFVVRDEKGGVIKTEEGNSMRLDVILHLGDNREVIIDSKVSLRAYVDYVNATNEEDRKAFLKEHLESVKKHVKELAKKDYSAYIKPPKVSAGFVMMFVPNAGALWAALRAEPSLWRWAADMNVYIADEQSLYGALRIVDMTWVQIKQAQNHEKVYDIANEMIKRVGEFVAQYNSLGRDLQKVVETYGKAGKKLEPENQSIITSAHKLIKLGADGKQLISVSSSKKETLEKVLKIDKTPLLPEGEDAEE